MTPAGDDSTRGSTRVVTFLQMVAVLIAGMAAGTINVVVGSGTLITFPTLLAFGVPPVTANVSNTIGLVPGVASGVIGYRRELKGQRARAIRLGSASLAGGVVGAVLLLVLPGGAFRAIVPALILLGLVLVVLQPRISAWVNKRHEGATRRVRPVVGVAGRARHRCVRRLLRRRAGRDPDGHPRDRINDSLQRLNGLKNVLAGLVNGVAGLIFVFVADVDWTVVALIAAGSIIGGQLGATVGRRLSPGGATRRDRDRRPGRPRVVPPQVRRATRLDVRRGSACAA